MKAPSISRRAAAVVLAIVFIGAVFNASAADKELLDILLSNGAITQDQ